MEKLVYILPMASLIYVVVACWWVGAFFRSSRANGRPTQESSDFTPPVSILKPVRGLDQDAYENFASFCRQDYPQYEVLFAVADPDDPIVGVIERVIRDFDAVPIKLLAGVSPAMASPKVNSLLAMSDTAAHPVLVVSDSDTRVGTDYLRRLVAPLAQDEVGLVTCSYRGVQPTTFTAKLEALHIGVTFLPQVVVARRFLDMHFAMGATVAFRKSDLDASGGWDTIGAYLADDNQLALQISALGKKVVLSHLLVDVHLGVTTWREHWQREVRWARTNRVNRPREYPGILLTLPVPLALVLLPVDPTGLLGWSVVAAAFFIRWVTAWFITGFTNNRPLRRWLPWLPLRDLLSALIWCAGVAGRSVVWRGEHYRVHADGRLKYRDREVLRPHPAGDVAPNQQPGRLALSGETRGPSAPTAQQEPHGD